MTLILSGLLGEDVAFESLTSFDRSACANRKALFGATLALHLGHKDPFNYLRYVGGNRRLRFLYPEALLTASTLSYSLRAPPYIRTR